MSTQYAYVQADGSLARLNDGYPAASKFGLAYGYSLTDPPDDLFTGGMAAEFTSSFPYTYSMLGNCAVWVTGTGQIKYEVANSLKSAAGLSTPVSIGDPFGPSSVRTHDLGGSLLMIASTDNSYDLPADQRSYPPNMLAAGMTNVVVSIVYLEDHVGTPVPAVKQWVLRLDDATWATYAAIDMTGKEFYEGSIGMVSLRGVFGYALQYGSGGFITNVLTGVFDLKEEFAPFLSLYAGAPPPEPAWWDLRSIRLSEV